MSNQAALRILAMARGYVPKPTKEDKPKPIAKTRKKPNHAR